MGFILSWLASACTFLAVAHLVPGFRVKNFVTALVCSLVLSVLLTGAYVLLAPFIVGAWLFGLFPLLNFVLLCVMLVVTDKLIDDFEIESTASVIIGALVFTIVRWLIHLFLRV